MTPPCEWCGIRRTCPQCKAAALRGGDGAPGPSHPAPGPAEHPAPGPAAGEAAPESSAMGPEPGPPPPSHLAQGPDAAPESSAMEPTANSALADSSLAPGDKATDTTHEGTESRYANHRCRCDACREAHRVYRAAQRRARGIPTRSPTRTHGIRATYIAGCRCDACRATEREYRIAWRARGKMGK